MIHRNAYFTITITQITKQLKIKQTLNKTTHLNKIKLIKINHPIKTKQIKTNLLIITKPRQIQIKLIMVVKTMTLLFILETIQQMLQILSS